MQEITHEDWVERQDLQFLYIYTPMCGTCQVASKMLHVTEQLVTSPIAQLNANFAPKLMVSEQIESVPCLLVRKNGVTYDKIYAFHSVPYLVETLNF